MKDNKIEYPLVSSIRITGTDKTIEKRLGDCFAGEEWILEGLTMNTSQNITVNELKSVFDNGYPPEDPRYKCSTFKFEINGLTYLSVPLSFLPCDDNSRFFYPQSVFGDKNPTDYKLKIRWNDTIKMSLSFWDNKPRPYVKVFVAVARIEEVKKLTAENAERKIN